MHTHRSIFRTEALQHYQQFFEKSVLPRFSKPVHITLLWGLVLFCLLCGMVVGLARVPAYVPGYIAASEIPGGLLDNRHASWTVLVPARHLSLLRLGQTINLQDQGDKRITKGVITKIESQVISPETAHLKFDFNNCLLPDPSESLAVATAESAPILSNRPIGVGQADWHRAEIEISTRRIGAFLPGIGSWYER